MWHRFHTCFFLICIYIFWAISGLNIFSTLCKSLIFTMPYSGFIFLCEYAFMWPMLLCQHDETWYTVYPRLVYNSGWRRFWYMLVCLVVYAQRIHSWCYFTWRQSTSFFHGCVCITAGQISSKTLWILFSILSSTTH